jgi:hypothetical protein
MAPIVWEQRPLENFIQNQLSSKLKTEGDDFWARYVLVRDEMINEVLPWIAANEPGLTDHGARHIFDVIDNAALLVGISNQHGEDQQAPKHLDFLPQEWLILIMGLVLHDVGNIFGRSRHNQKIPEVWRANKGAWNAWSLHQRQIITNVGRAHSGLAASGSKDTLEPLATSSNFFEKVPIRAAEIAAIIRFADELAEGPQRTSQFMISQNLVKPESEIYHQYAKITQVSIDREGGRVALSYSIDVDDATYPTDNAEKREFIGSLLNMIYSRAAKMNYERQFARHYAAVLSPFKQTSVSLSLYRDGMPVDLSLMPVVLTDMSVLHNADFKLEAHNPEYEVERLLKGMGL